MDIFINGSIKESRTNLELRLKDEMFTQSKYYFVEVRMYM